ncbi:chitobiase/beta-hexosaminidase C-terminal domain-containing protein [Methanothermobacter wolfeii]|uniref:chitobiase/beta-hexosaminidase C-terminal domain-containing protein n=1 Tax=Methanothermobacter wolfeii TaxID=145261 RepID=UPI0024B37CB6|nr:chitobiase/beta-hexosaminidase C-terminal domain-containing protein [Methanothermobacter wolfeii]MDI6701957.1 chitobiase/beta-hexosaminidase C-terminal domain-containing protein [Methanothermobacter wolfeii]
MNKRFLLSALVLLAFMAGISSASAVGDGNGVPPLPDNAVNLTMQQNPSDPEQIIVNVSYSDELQNVSQDIAVDAMLEILEGDNITGANIKWYYTGVLNGSYANYTVPADVKPVWLSSFEGAPVPQGQAKLYMEDGQKYTWLFVVENARGKVFKIRANSTAIRMVDNKPEVVKVLASEELTVDLQPHFSLSDLKVEPVSGSAPLTVMVRVNVTNTGVADDYTAELKINGEVKNTTTLVNLATGETREVIFTYELPAGLYNVTVDDLTPVSVTSIPAAPSASPASGTYLNNVTVTLTGPEGSTIYYTTDGSTPTVSSNKYTAPIVLSRSATLKFIAVANSTSSAVSSAKYTVLKPATLTYYVKVKVKKWYKKWYKYRGKWRYKWRYYWTYRYVKRTSTYWQMT